MNPEQLNPESDFTPASYKLRVNGKVYEFTNPEPTARDIFERIGIDPTTHALILTSPNGERRMLALDEETDLRRPGIEEFTWVTMLRKFSIYVDETPVDFDKPDPTGLEILQRVGKHPDRYALTQIILGEEEDQFIGAQEKADLLRKGIEKFTSVPWDEIKKEVTIIVNAQQKVVTVSELSYDALVKLAFDTPPTGGNVLFSVTYRRGQGNKPEGSLSQGEVVKIKEGMIFNVTPTNQS